VYWQMKHENDIETNNEMKKYIQYEIELSSDSDNEMKVLKKRKWWWWWEMMIQWYMKKKNDDEDENIKYENNEKYWENKWK